MKKAVTGCLVVVLLAVVLGGAAGYWFIVRPMWNAGSAMVDAASQWQQVAELEQEVDSDAAYTAPDDGRLSADQVRDFVAIQQAIADALGEDWKTLEAKYEALESEMSEQGREPDLAETFGAYQDLSGLILTAKRAQVDALNRAGLGLEEYRWIRDQSYAALGLAAADNAPTQFEGTALAANAELLRPHRELLQQTLATSWLGF